MDDPAAVDWSNPCLRAAALSTAYHTMLVGGRPQKIRYRSADDVEEEVTYTEASITGLRKAMIEAQAECALQTTGARRRRFAIVAGGRRIFGS